METFEIYAGEVHLGSLYIENNRYSLEAEVEGFYGFEMKDCDFGKPIPFLERILAKYNNDLDAVVLKDDESNITLYKID